MPARKVHVGTYTVSTSMQDTKIRARQKTARKIYKTLATKNQEVLDEVLDQIVYCVQLNIFLSEMQIREMLLCQNELQVERKARTYKFA